MKMRGCHWFVYVNIYIRSSLLREIFAAVREDPSLLQPLQDEFVARGGELPVISESYLVDNSSGCLGCIVRNIKFTLHKLI